MNVSRLPIFPISREDGLQCPRRAGLQSHTANRSWRRWCLVGVHRYAPSHRRTAGALEMCAAQRPAKAELSSMAVQPEVQPR